jgi:hypothetical protein
MTLTAYLFREHYTSFLVSVLIMKGTCVKVIKAEVKGHSRTGHEGPEGKHRNSFTLSLTSALDGVGGQRHTLAVLPPRNRLRTHCTGGWADPAACLDWCEGPHPHRNSIPGPSSSKQVAIPTILSRRLIMCIILYIIVCIIRNNTCM